MINHDFQIPIERGIASLQHTFNTFVGGKLLGPTFLGSPTVRTVGVGVTFSLLLWKFCWTYRFWLPNSKNCWPFRTVVETFDSFVGATFLTFVGPTVLGPYYCWGDFSPFVGPTISGSQDCWSYFPVFCCSYSNCFRPPRTVGVTFVGPTKGKKSPQRSWRDKTVGPTKYRKVRD